MRKILGPSVLASLAVTIFAGASLLTVPAGCSVDGSIDEQTSNETDAILGASAVSRAEQWVSAQLHYCQAANHQRDYDDACTTYCNRTDNPLWDPYRSDCSGLVSWAWDLPAPGRVTSEFAPFQNDITHVIQGVNLLPGDAVNNSDHVMLFKAWITPGHRATFIEEPGCATAITHAHEFDTDVTINGSTVYVSYWGKSFTAIRLNAIGTSGGGGSSSSGCVLGGLYCGGDKLGGDHNTLYRCEGSAAPTVVENCANGCSVNSGSNDSCNAGSGTSGGTCVQGGLYCGGDKVSGNSSTLYRCNGPGTPTVVEQCANGCAVNAGSNDSCKSGGAPPPSGGNCVVGGLYCGGDKVTGNSSTLYKCNGPGTPTVEEQCAHGCSVNAGANDSCKTAGSGGCVAGGLYCGGDKVTGDASTLYKCTSGSSGTVVQHCASGCAVHAGTNDACR